MDNDQCADCRLPHYRRGWAGRRDQRSRDIGSAIAGYVTAAVDRSWQSYRKKVNPLLMIIVIFIIGIFGYWAGFLA
jgi:hypothetical protein